MSTKKDCISNFTNILIRLHRISGLENEYEIAELLGFKKDTFAARKSRGSIPEKEIKLACVSKGWNFNWVMYEEGPMKKNEDTTASEGFPQISDYQLESADPNLIELIDILHTEPPETVRFILDLVKGRKLQREALKALSSGE